MLRHPDLYRRHVELAFQLYGGKLSPRDRELVVLRIGWLCKAPYEWGEHVKIGKRVGLTPEEIERATCGSTAPGWGEHDRAIVRAAEELHEDAMISDETWEVLSRRLDEQQLIELPLLVGQYQGLAYLQNALRLRLIPGNPGLSAR
jgi:alkylhydroperoxidase family enzyme